MRRRRVLLMPQPPGSNAVVLQEYRGLDDGRRGDQDQYYYHHYVPPPEQPNLVSRIMYWIRRTMILCLQIILLTCTSTVSYAAFYRYHQPKLILHRELHFDYFHQHEESAVAAPIVHSRRWRWAQKLAQLIGKNKPQLEPSAITSVPTALLHFDDDEVQWWLGTAATTDDDASNNSTTTAVSQRYYYAEILLQLPESAANLQAGMWDLRLELLRVGNNSTTTPVATSHRSLHFPYRSPWIRTVRNLATLVPLLLELVDESQWMRIPMLRQQPLFHSTTHTAGVAAARCTCGAPELTSAYLILGEEWSVVYTILRGWFGTAAMVGTMTFAVVYLVSWNILMYCCGVRRQEPQPEQAYYYYDSPSLNGSFFVEEVPFPQDAGMREEEFVDAPMDHPPTTTATTASDNSPSLPPENMPTHIPQQPVEFEDDGSEYWEELSIGSFSI